MVWLILLVPGLCRANAAALERPAPNGGGRLHVAKENGLEVEKEIITFDVRPDDLSAAVRVEYHIANTRDAPFDGELFFIAPHEFTVRDFDITLGTAPVSCARVSEEPLDEDIHEKIKRFSGCRFSVALAGGERQTVVVRYSQQHGYHADRKNPSFAASSHLLNAARHGSYVVTAFYRYYLFPILSFSEGVGEVVIRVTWPKRTREGRRVENFADNLGLAKVREDRRTATYEGRFTEVPADLFEFSLYVGRWDRLGVTLHPAYKLELPRKHHAFFLGLTLDVIIRNLQLSLGAQYSVVDTLQLLQEVKLFPPGAAWGMAGLFDYRFSLGVVEQLHPTRELGFKTSAGIRIFLALELTYQMFPPILGEDWRHEILVGIPVSF